MTTITLTELYVGLIDDLRSVVKSVAPDADVAVVADPFSEGTGTQSVQLVVGNGTALGLRSGHGLTREEFRIAVWVRDLSDAGFEDEAKFVKATGSATEILAAIRRGMQNSRAREQAVVPVRWLRSTTPAVERNENYGAIQVEDFYQVEYKMADD